MILLPKQKYKKEKYEQITGKEEMVFVDIETTGLNKNFDYILEVALIKYSNGKEIKKFHTFVDNDIKFKANSLNKITYDMVKNHMSPEEMILKTKEFIGNSIIVGHNVSFDVGFLNEEFVNNNIDFKFENKTICTLYLAKYKLPNLISHKLIDMMKYYKIDFTEEDIHFAMFDIESTTKIFFNLIKEEMQQIKYYEKISETNVHIYLDKKELEIKNKYKVYSFKTLTFSWREFLFWNNRKIVSKYFTKKQEKGESQHFYITTQKIIIDDEKTFEKNIRIDKNDLKLILNWIELNEENKFFNSFKEIVSDFEYDASLSFSKKKKIFVFTKNKLIGSFPSLLEAYKNIYDIEIINEKNEKEMKQILKVAKITKDNNKKFNTAYGYIWTFDHNLGITNIINFFGEIEDKKKNEEPKSFTSYFTVNKIYSIFKNNDIFDVKFKERNNSYELRDMTKSEVFSKYANILSNEYDKYVKEWNEKFNK